MLARSADAANAAVLFDQPLQGGHHHFSEVILLLASAHIQAKLNAYPVFLTPKVDNLLFTG